MRQLNLLNHKRSVRRHWELQLHSHAKLPEIVMEGEHVIHTDEDGNILLDQEADRWIDHKQQASDEFDALFKALEEDRDGKGRELAEKFFRDDAIFLERMQNTICPITNRSLKTTDCSDDKPLKPRVIIASKTN